MILMCEHGCSKYCTYKQFYLNFNLNIMMINNFEFTLLSLIKPT